MIIKVKQTWLPFFILLAAVILISGLSLEANAAPKGKLISSYASPVGSMDSMISTGGGNWPTLSVGIWEGLILINAETYRYEPWLSESWEILENGMVWEFKLRKGVTFQNGEPFNAQAVKFSFDRMMGKGEWAPELRPKFKPRLRGMFGRLVKSIEIIDDYTIRFTMKRKTMEVFVRFGAAVPMVPPKYLLEVGDEAFAKKPIGTGAFKIVGRKIGESITLEAYANYWNKAPKKGQTGVPYIKTIFQRLIPEDETRISALRVGEIDLAVNIASHRVKSLEKEKNIGLKFHLSNAPVYVGINTAKLKDPKTGKPNPFLDLRVRKALSMSINREEIVKHILTGREPLHFMLTPGQLGFTEELAKKYIPAYDPKGARKLLAEAGYPKGIDAVLHAASGRLPMTKEVTDAIAGYLTAAGIRTKVSIAEYRVISAKIRTNELYPLDFFLAAPGPEPAFALRGAFHSKNVFGLHKGDPVMDKLIDEAFAEFDHEKRAKIYQKIFIYHAENAVFFAPLYNAVSVTGLRSDRWSWDISKWAGYPEFFKIKPIK